MHIITPHATIKINISRSFFYSYPTYAGNFEHISFEAFFIPSCSWLNDKVKDGLKAYVLQHEQIHFALAELTAHKVTHTAKEGLGQYIVFGNTNNEIKTKLMAKARELAQSVINSELKIQTAFDEDTSGVYAPKIQQQWWEDVEKRLAEDRKLSGELQ